MGVKDSYELAWQDWQGTAGFDRPEDLWPARWAEAYVQFAAGEKRSWMHERGIRFLPNPGWAERGGYGAIGHGNSVPRFHVTWGTGPGVIAPFVSRVREGVARGLVELRFRHRVDALSITGGAVDGVSGSVLEPSGVAPRRGEFARGRGRVHAERPAVIVTCGGIGGHHELVRKTGRPGSVRPGAMISGVPAHVDGRMLQIAEDAGGNTINPDRMWHYVEGINNWDPIWPRTGSGSCPDRRRCGSTRPASGCRSRCSPASTRWARSNTS